MAASSSDFPAAKAAIIGSMKNTQFCDNYTEVCSSENFRELMMAGCGNYAWSYQAVLDDTTLALFPETELNPFGVYTSNVTLVNPDQYIGCKTWYLLDEEAPEEYQELYFVGSSNSSLTISENKKYIVYVMGDASLELNITSCGGCKLKLFNNATATINVEGSANIDIEANNKTSLNIHASNQSVIYVQLRGFSNAIYLGENESVAQFKAFARSHLEYYITDPSQVFIEQNDKSTILNTSP